MKLGDDLMVRGNDGVLRRVLYKEEIGLILQQCHDESGHPGRQQLVLQVLRAGFHWPTMIRDAFYWCRTCHLCQEHGDRRLTSEPYKPIISYGAFEQWGIDAVGPLPRSKRGRKYILVAIDYLTRWVEARAIKEVNTKETIDFIHGNICTRFGVPLVILTDRGLGF